jgi:hypothetical protein
MDQRPPPCVHRAPRLPVPSTTTPTAPAPPNIAAWPHHPDATYTSLMPGTVGVTTSDHRQTSTAGYFSSPYSVPPTFSQMGITSPGHVTRWWAQEGHDWMSTHGSLSYFPYTYTGPAPCGSETETQDDRFSMPQAGEMQMSVTGLGQMSAPARPQGPSPGESQVPYFMESQVPLSGESQVSDFEESQMPPEGDVTVLSSDQLAPDSPQDMLSDDDQQPPPEDGVDEEHASDPAHTN